MSPTNLAKAAMPASVKEVAADVTDMKDTFKDPLGLKKEEEAAEGKTEGKEPAAAPAAKAAPETSAPEA
jgi:hypothetical protein